MRHRRSEQIRVHSLKTYMPSILMGVRQGMQDIGCTSFANLVAASATGALRFELRSPGALCAHLQQDRLLES
jgi:hypothetical protein